MGKTHMPSRPVNVYAALLVWLVVVPALNVITMPARGAVFDSGSILPGRDFSFTFTVAGTYNYYCTIHPVMLGKVIVQDQNATLTHGDKSVDIVGVISPYYNPPTLYILTGTKVTWTNRDSMTHTVTEKSDATTTVPTPIAANWLAAALVSATLAGLVLRASRSRRYREANGR